MSYKKKYSKKNYTKKNSQKKIYVLKYQMELECDF